MKFVPNAAEHSETRFGAATVRERLAASALLIQQRGRSPYWLQLVRDRKGWERETIRACAVGRPAAQR